VFLFLGLGAVSLPTVFIVSVIFPCNGNAVEEEFLFISLFFVC
jgi:hypothetical protein